MPMVSGKWVQGVKAIETEPSYPQTSDTDVKVESEYFGLAIEQAFQARTYSSHRNNLKKITNQYIFYWLNITNENLSVGFEAMAGGVYFTRT